MTPATVNQGFSPEALLNSASVLRAFIECSDELQGHAKNMVQAMCDPDLDDDDRYLAATTLLEILLPYHNEVDHLYGLDLEQAEQLVRHHPFAKDDPQGQECNETAAVLDKMDEEEATFAARLQALMDEKQLTQVALAATIGVSQPAIALMLKRDCRPQKRTILKIAQALNVSPKELWPSFAAMD